MNEEIRKALVKQQRAAISSALESLGSASGRDNPLTDLLRAQHEINKAVGAACALDADEAELFLKEKR